MTQCRVMNRLTQHCVIRREMKILSTYVMWRIKMWPYDPKMCGFYDVTLIVFGMMLTIWMLK